MAALSARAASPSELDILKLLTTRLPDSAQLSMLTIDGDRVLLEGTAPNAKDVVRALNQIQTFSSVRLRDVRTMPGGQHFSIMLALSEPGTP